MTLSDFLSAADLTDEAFASRVKISRPMISKLRKRVVTPSAQLASRIIEATESKVSFAELMPLAAEVAA